ncbi:MAG: hypothetical protein ACPGL0_13980, partial [Limisphaerales bacterium]
RWYYYLAMVSGLPLPWEHSLLRVFCLSMQVVSPQASPSCFACYRLEPAPHKPSFAPFGFILAERAFTLECP